MVNFAENRKAFYDYEILDTLEAGIMLTGTEVKSLRIGKAQITEAYASPGHRLLRLTNPETVIRATMPRAKMYTQEGTLAASPWA